LQCKNEIRSTQSGATDLRKHWSSACGLKSLYKRNGKEKEKEIIFAPTEKWGSN